MVERRALSPSARLVDRPIHTAALTAPAAACTVGAMASGPAIGWAGSRPLGFNAGEQAVGSIRRIPIDGLTTVRARALALVPAGLDAGRPIEVLVHLHGHGRAFEEQGSRAPGDVRGQVRDVDVDRAEDQLAGAGRPMIALLPQGTSTSDFNPGRGGGYPHTPGADPARPGANLLPAHPNPGASLAPVLPASFAAQPDKGLDVQAFVDEALAALAALGILDRAPEVARAVLSAHSGGGGPLSLVLTEDGAGRMPRALGAVLLFDAVNGDEELSRVLAFVDRALGRDAAALASLGDAAAQLGYLQASTRFVAVTTGAPFYAARHHALDDFLRGAFDAQKKAFGDEVLAAWRESFAVVFSAHHDHDTLVGSGCLEDALRALPAPPSRASA
jgi:hypothetical protein